MTVDRAHALIETRDLRVSFLSRDATVHAVNGVNLTVDRGETVCILGESGSGKSVTLRALIRLLPPRRSAVGGSVLVDGQDVMKMSGAQLASMRGAKVAMIFQEPALAFDPVYTVGRQIIETIIRHEGTSGREAHRRALQLLDMVRIPSAARRLKAYPHELSGGMRQRAMIALALCCRPAVLLADEPTTALDASVQIQILLLLRDLQRELGMSVVFVTHDVGVAIEIADRIAVMYAGRFVETGPVATVIKQPLHPTRAVCSRPRCTAPCAASGSKPFLARRPTCRRCRRDAASLRAVRTAPRRV